jgi:leader peptidase (prepilin peptidase)/N-methyltransferase
MPAVLIAAAGLLGLAVGSFLNVVIHRVPAGESVVSPPSACPACGTRIRARHNVPVLSWLWLRGRCANCAEPISVRYPLVELATGVLFAAITFELVRSDRLALAPALLFFTALGIALAFIDAKTYRLPNVLVLPAYPVLAVLITGAAAISGDWSIALRAAVGAAALTAAYLAVALVKPGGLGFGDVKLAGLVGGMLAALSYQALIVGAFAAFLLGSLVGVALMLRQQAGRRTAVPFGPFMIAGTLLSSFVGGPLADAYTRLVLRT